MESGRGMGGGGDLSSLPQVYARGGGRLGYIYLCLSQPPQIKTHQSHNIIFLSRLLQSIDGIW